jgi:glycosyltransferase involved in cell wall biosynthesis
MTERPRVSVVIPAYNEGDRVVSVLDRLFESVRLPSEVLVVVDTADDTTVPVTEEYAQKEPRLRCLGSLRTFAHVGTRDATNSFKAYSTEFVRQVGIESRDGFEIGIELTAKAKRLRLPVAEIPTIWLDRQAGVSNFKIAKWVPSYLHWYRFAFGPQLTADQMRHRDTGRQDTGHQREQREGQES